MLPAPAAPQKERLIKIVFADDHHLIIDAFARHLKQFKHLHVAGFAHDGEALLQLVAAVKPDIVLPTSACPGRMALKWQGRSKQNTGISN